jgi:hypothetical protein
MALGLSTDRHVQEPIVVVAVVAVLDLDGVTWLVGVEGFVDAARRSAIAFEETRRDRAPNRPLTSLPHESVVPPTSASRPDMGDTVAEA